MLRMFRRTATWIALAAIALASIEAAAVRAALPRARNALSVAKNVAITAPPATRLLRVARGVTDAVVAVAETRLVQLSGNLVLGAVQGTTKVLGIVASAAAGSSRCTMTRGSSQGTIEAWTPEMRGASTTSHRCRCVVVHRVVGEPDARVRVAI